jgi:hypothetical protein
MNLISQICSTTLCEIQEERIKECELKKSNTSVWEN